MFYSYKINAQCDDADMMSVWEQIRLCELQEPNS